MKTVLVTGANGQLGTCIKQIANSYKNTQFIYTNTSNLDITNKTEVFSFFKNNNIDYCINCAAYTAVDKAEEEVDKATEINVIGVKNLAKACNKNNTTLIHISTDFVFDGNKQTPYKETDTPNPKSIYGLTKLQGEQQIPLATKKYFIIRTSWLYSEFGNNFMKTMLKLGKVKDELRVINDQKGTPTYAKDLAKIILKIINATNIEFGIYHYSNDSETTWYGFSKKIVTLANIQIKIKPITTAAYKTAAERPKYSVLDTKKLKKALCIEIPIWQKSLKKAIHNCKKQA